MSEAAAAAGFSRWLSDERLTRRACGGDDHAFAAIFRRYHQPLYRFCLSIVGNPEDAQDALQNTMVKVLRALPGEERTIELKPWLYRIAHNEAIDLLRRRRETRELDTEQPAPGYGLAEDAATRDRLRRLLADLRELPERQREVLVMRELSGLEFEEIGAALGTTDAVARQTLYEARQSLRQMAEGREMSCDQVTRALSDGDGRVTRRRDVRAHLRSCAECRAFRDEIQHRQHDLAALSPLPAIAAAGILQGLAGGSGAAGGSGLAAALGGGAAKTISASAAAKGVATVAAAAVVGVGAADRTGVIHLGLPGEGGSQPAKSAPGHHHAHPAHPAPGHEAGGHDGNRAAGSPGRAKGEGVHGQGGTRAHPGRGAKTHKAVPGANPHGGPPAHAQDQGQHQGGPPGPLPGKAPEHSQTPGSPASPPAQGGNEKPPNEASGGGGAPADRQPPTPEPGGSGGAEPVMAPTPQAPESPGSQAKEPPPNPPPAAAPEPPGQAPSQPGPPQGKGPEAKP